MEEIRDRNIEEWLTEGKKRQGLHVECSPDMADRIRKAVQTLTEQGVSAGFATRTDQGYERETVRSYLSFWEALNGGRQSAGEAIKGFGLTKLAGVKLLKLTSAQRLLVQLARVSLQKAEIYFLEDPLANLDSDSVGRVLGWMAAAMEQGTCFVTANASLRNALLMPGTAYYIEEGRFCPVEAETDDDEDEEELTIRKIPAKAGDRTLLFEPKEIDYIESLDKCNYLSVRGSLYPAAFTMDELESRLERCGFFRCHRSYIVNMQRVREVEKLTKNSFTLLLNDTAGSRIPLSKGRATQMKETFGW